MSHRPKTSVYRLCERTPFIQWLFSKRGKTLPKFGDGIRMGQEDALRWFADSVIIFLGLVMLYGPMWWLQWVDDDVKRLAIITCFVFVFAMGLRLMSTMRPFEALAATAAYAAVLMVYMQKSST
jgi:hypothetical protein